MEDSGSLDNLGLDWELNSRERRVLRLRDIQQRHAAVFYQNGTLQASLDYLARVRKVSLRHTAFWACAYSVESDAHVVQGGIWWQAVFTHGDEHTLYRANRAAPVYTLFDDQPVPYDRYTEEQATSVYQAVDELTRLHQTGELLLTTYLTEEHAMSLLDPPSWTQALGSNEFEVIGLNATIAS